MRGLFLLPFLLPFLLSTAQESPQSLTEAVASITMEDVHARIGILAHDSMGGRDTPSPGLEMAAVWAAGEFSRMGLEPGGDDGTFIQRYEMTPRGADPEASTTASVPNVVGFLFGSDPELRDEWVVMTAHFDHVTGSADDTGGDIYNGADDNASGTAAILEIAEAFSLLPTSPRRSMAFVLVSGEEKGLLGASHFAGGASLPQEAMVADINADMVSRNSPDGIPGIFFFSGLHPDLHRPSDELEKVDCDKAARVARLMFYLGYEVAQDDERPQWTDAGRELLVGLGVVGR